MELLSELSPVSFGRGDCIISAASLVGVPFVAGAGVAAPLPGFISLLNKLRAPLTKLVNPSLTVRLASRGNMVGLLTLLGGVAGACCAGWSTGMEMGLGGCDLEGALFLVDVSGSVKRKLVNAVIVSL